MALALYRRYRPDTFDGIVGQDQVTIPLSRALDEGKLTHAYLFSGPRGCGKTSSARILARCVNCEKGPTSHPCGECESCRDLATGGPGSIDVVEIDAASHNGVEDARELRERAGFAPARDRYKIFILDEAHMVTPQGFNALLKIVEEPPEHVLFIFATTEPEKVIGTIRSRTHHYPFRLVPPEIMGPYLEDICGKESIKPEPGVLKLAMRAGGGSMRDTLSVLDQLMVGAVDGVIAYDSAVALLGFTPDALISEAIDAVIDRNGEQLYSVIQKVIVGGFDPRRFVEDLLSRVRDLLVLTIAGERAESVLSDDAEAEDRDDLRRQSSALGLTRLTQIADVINATLGAMSGSTSPRMRLELLAAKLLVPPTAIAVTGAGSPGTAAATTGTARQSGNSADGHSGATAGGARGGGFAGAKRNQPSASAASGHTPVGEAGAHSATEVGSSSVSSSATSSSVLPPTGGAVTPGVTEGASNTGATPSSDWTTSSASANASATDSAAPDTRTPDEKWDALIASLPEDVRKYVSRDRVPRINLSPNPKNGRMCLWIKFDKAINKYAFALAVASESVNGHTKVVDILREATHEMFGSDVQLAPTKKMADGQVAPPFGKLPPAEQQQIKAKLLQASLGGMTAGAMAQPAQSRAHNDAADGTPSAHDADTDVHRAGLVSPGPDGTHFAGPDAEPDGWGTPAASASTTANTLANTSAAANDGDPWGSDPWANPTPAASDGTVQSVSSQPTSASHNDGVMGDDPWASSAPVAGDDPWAGPAGGQTEGTAAPASGYQDLSQQHAAPKAEHHAKHVAVPDLSDDEDPWAQSAQPTPMQSTVGQPGPQSAASRPNGPASQSATPEHHFNPNARFGQQTQNGFGGPGQYGQPGQANGFGQSSVGGIGNPAPGVNPNAQPVPQVDPDEDEYSMSDESLNVRNAMNLDDLKRFFDVKSVETLAPDDPNNPRNIVAKRKAASEEE
ncbi:DNA polymerase III subunit gamma/tau [Bifidobacterium callimiconis]|uniref:DNA polymerase III subunit gamma/tau n=1 Tax=Bifidobacterium callimiconis TaxID=2306973 RepID=UPI001BDC7416|nr:DNA polymerase III subunit gamma/tau [Bifidobacterium callimiconis]MBT1177649.1 DNA polymerase III subunit gamma/tau [Bifidobacterium callimiconis]